MKEAGLYADRLSINLEIPTESGLKLLAPEKSHKQMTKPMNFIKNELVLYKEEKKIFRKVPKFAPAGQSTQMIVGATNETDLKIIKVADHFYQNYNMKRVYYSGYVPMIEDSRLPSVFSQVPMQRENRLYQADWLMRFYGFEANEILDQKNPFLDLEIDPKLAWALRNREKFPVNINTAPKEMLLRIPGIGVNSVLKILQARKFQKLNLGHLKKMGVATNRAKYFIEFESENIFNKLIDEQNFRQIVLNGMKSKWQNPFSEQLSLF
jgi:putative DNA modification/repair radical SAM protein